MLSYTDNKLYFTNLFYFHCFRLLQSFLLMTYIIYILLNSQKDNNKWIFWMPFTDPNWERTGGLFEIKWKVLHEVLAGFPNTLANMNETLPTSGFSLASRTYDDDHNGNTEEKLLDTSDWYDITSHLILLIGAIFTIVFNVLFLAILSRPTLKNPADICLKILAVCDIVAVCCNVAYTVSSRLEIYYDVEYYLNNVSDWFVPFNIPAAVHGISVYLTLTMTIQQYIIVCHPMKAHVWMSKTKLYILAMCATICPAILGAISICMRYFLNISTTWYTIVTFVLPFLVILILTVLTMRGLIQSHRHQSTLTQGNDPTTSSRIRTSLIILIILVMFLVVEFPSITYKIVIWLYLYTDKAPYHFVKHFTNAVFVMEAIKVWLYPIEIFLYCFMSKKFRAELFNLITCLCK